MMHLISRLPKGMVVFPGFESGVDWGSQASEQLQDFDVIRTAATPFIYVE